MSGRAGSVRLTLGAVIACVLALGSPLALARVNANDPAFVDGLQWGLERIGAPEAWERATGAGTIIAIVDSGADLEHEDLRGRIHSSANCIGAGGDPHRCTTGDTAQDDNGHGTHVAGIAAAHTGNGRGIAGVAPRAQLMIVRVLRNECSNPADRSSCTASGTAGDVAAGIRWAADHGADVINLSLGGGAVQSVAGCSFCDAVEYAWDQGAIPVVAAGNDAVLPAGFGREPAVVVTATTRDDRAAPYSNTNSGLLRDARWPVAAPGGRGETDAGQCGPGGNPLGILSTYLQPGRANSYACLAGTSMAAPHVSGALAVLLSQGRTPLEAVDRLLATADDLGPRGRDATFGYGRVNLARAVGSAPSPTTAPPTTSPPTTAAPGGDPPPAPPPEPGQPMAPPTTTAPAPAPEVAVDLDPGDPPPDTPAPEATDQPDDDEAATAPPAPAGDPAGAEPIRPDDVPPALIGLAALLALGALVATGLVATRPGPAGRLHG